MYNYCRQRNHRHSPSLSLTPPPSPPPPWQRRAFNARVEELTEIISRKHRPRRKSTTRKEDEKESCNHILNVVPNGTFDLAINGFGGVRAIRKLLDVRVSVNAVEPRVKGCWTLLKAATKSSDIAAIKCLVEAKADVNQHGLEMKDDKVRKLEEEATSTDDNFLPERESITRSSLSSENQDHAADPPLRIAIEQWNREVVEYFITKCSASVVYLQSNEPIGFAVIDAARCRDYRIMKLVVEEGKGELNSQREDKFTPLMLAAANGNKACVKYLLQKGANVMLKHTVNNHHERDIACVTAFEVARKAGEVQIAQIICEQQRIVVSKILLRDSAIAGRVLLEQVLNAMGLNYVAKNHTK
mmetsp:Transcript_1799/g.4142  ORF Transcript_1799/g.4142 Transcript_1799/m.4142 type:complete len:357 (-) Transcript_1799:179-1249(-)